MFLFPLMAILKTKETFAFRSTNAFFKKGCLNSSSARSVVEAL